MCSVIILLKERGNFMKLTYTDLAKKLKAIADPKRLKIIDMLSCGELCACIILESFNITQPTLSHHMKILIEAGLVKDRREGKNIYYSLDNNAFVTVLQELDYLSNNKPDCICHLKKN